MCNMSALSHTEFTEEKKNIFESKRGRLMVSDGESVQGPWGS